MSKESREDSRREDIRREKAALRAAMTKTLETLPEHEIARRSRRALEHLGASELWRGAQGLVAFASMAREVQTDELLRSAWEQGKRVALPRMNGDHLVFHEIVDDPPRLVRRVWGIREPEAAAPPAALLDRAQWPAPLILVPGLAFDTLGHRLGRGRGFYDRFLASLSAADDDTSTSKESSAAAGAVTVGFAFQCQIVARVPSDEWDMRVDYLLTEDGLRRVG
jgi:5-formyltetrahydrofolate cyclo-ligase